MFLLEYWILLQTIPSFVERYVTIFFLTHTCTKTVKAHIFNVYNIECNTVCEFRMVMSQNVTFLSLCSLVQIYYFKNGRNVTVTSQIISTQNFIALFYLTPK